MLKYSVVFAGNANDVRPTHDQDDNSSLFLDVLATFRLPMRKRRLHCDVVSLRVVIQLFAYTNNGLNIPRASSNCSHVSLHWCRAHLYTAQHSLTCIQAVPQTNERVWFLVQLSGQLSPTIRLLNFSFSFFCFQAINERFKRERERERRTNAGTRAMCFQYPSPLTN